MKILVPIRQSEGHLEFSEYAQFKKDVLKLNSNKNLIGLLNYNDEIFDITFNVTSKHKLKRENLHFTFFKEENFKRLEKDFLIIEVVTKYKEEKVDGILKGFYEYMSSNFLFVLSILFNISYEFSLDFMRGAIIGKNNQLLGKTKILFNYFEYAYESKLKHKWPQVESIDVLTTLNWLSNHNISLVDKSSCKASRAINALSQTFGEILAPTSPHLFWVMLGIEALLAEGNNNITNQIRTKAIILFGEPKEFKKKLNQLYDYRSRFVHGDIDIPSKLFYEDEEDFNIEYRQQLDFGMSILISLIRKLIHENKTEFKFEYIYCH